MGHLFNQVMHRVAPSVFSQKCSKMKKMKYQLLYWYKPLVVLVVSGEIFSNCTFFLWVYVFCHCYIYISTGLTVPAFKLHFTMYVIY